MASSSSYSAVHGTLDGKGSGAGESRKRKVPDSVTANACVNCQTARAKCDGGRPVCQRCASRNIGDTCEYRAHSKNHKDELLRDNQKLQQELADAGVHKRENVNLKLVIHAWVNGQHSPATMEHVKERVKRGDPYDEISKDIESSDSAPSSDSLSPLSRQMSHHRLESQESHPALSFWTDIGQDPSLIHHLMNLYWAWIHPSHVLLDRARFLQDFWACSGPSCSHALVNVICAAGCFVDEDHLHAQASRRQRMTDLQGKFLRKSQEHMEDLRGAKSLTNAQTWTIMFLVQVGAGSGHSAALYLRAAVEHLMKLAPPKELSKSDDVVPWGILTLHTLWCGLSFQKPSAPVSTSFEDLQRRLKVDDDDNDLWTPYPIEQEQAQEQPGNFAATAVAHILLYRIIHKTILRYCGGSKILQTQELLRLIQGLGTWRASLPSGIAELGPHPLPHVLSLHIQYHSTIIHLLEPLLSDPTNDTGVHKWLAFLIRRHALQAWKLLCHYRATYTCLYISPLHLFFLVHVCDTLVRHGAPPDDEGVTDSAATTSGTVTFCLTFLNEMSGHYPAAKPLMAMFGESLQDLRVDLLEDQRRLLAGCKGVGLEDKLNVCGRETYRLPVEQLLSNVEVGVAQEVVDRLLSEENTATVWINWILGTDIKGKGKGKGRMSATFEPDPLRRGASSNVSPEQDRRDRGRDRRVDIDSILN